MTVRDALVQSVEALERELSEHKRILSLALKEGDGKDVNLPSYRSHSERGELRQTLLDAIEVLEETRASFKSKRLEHLRKKLTRILAKLS